MALNLSLHSPISRSCARLLLTSICLVRLSAAADLTLPSQTLPAGQSLATAVAFSAGGTAISGLQFDLEWDDGLSVQLAAGTSIAASNKLLYTAQLANRKIRVLVIGTGQGSISDGELVRLFVAAGSVVGALGIRFSNPLGASPDGESVDIGTLSATIRVDNTSSGAPLVAGGVLNAASLRPGPVAPGEMLTLFGVFGIEPGATDSVVVNVNGSRATVLYALGNQINAVAPVALDASRLADLGVRSQNRQIAVVTIPTAPASPAIFTQDGSGVGPGAILNEDYTLNSPANPALAGSEVMIYATGFGDLNPPAKDGAFGVLSATVLPVSASIGDLPAEVTYAGAAPGSIAGLVQINLKIPAGITPDPAAPVSLSAGKFTTQSGVRISVR